MSYRTASNISESQTSEGVNQEQQLFNLCASQGAITAACIARSAIKYGSFESNRDASLSAFQSFQCKLAQFCHNDSGGAANTSLVCLVFDGGAEFLFTTNFRKPAELEEIKRGLEDLLRYATTNPEKLNPKPLQKMILWRFLEFCFKRVGVYFRTLSRALDECIDECESAQESTITRQLCELKSRVEFPREMTDTARNKVLRDCETFIKAIEASKNSSLGGEIDRRARQDDHDQAYKWCELRHCLGRLYSYRQAAEAVVEATMKWPEVFRSFKVNYIEPAKQKKAAPPKSARLADVLHYAFPEHELEEFQDDIAELQKYGLESEIRKQVFDRKTKTFIHAEVHMHDYLTTVRKVKPSDFWDGKMFIATSKSVCRLCHFYFQNDDNEFSVQPPHMNLYPKWRLPDNASEEVLEDLIDKMQQNTLNLITDKQPYYRRYDSRTDSQGLQTRSTHRTVFDRSTAPSPLGGRSSQSGVRPGGYHNEPPPPSHVLDDTLPLESAFEDYGVIGGERASARNGGSMIGVGF
ncbi:unnamed protein product [Clonostachys chloroleuca]|uniref:Uncharacterized protein n=1 Tax=Clonostachys chloroleuca TaxID=1926264 RepID=A0AA35QFJ1_9HYPO|nr:unnamed protein product [Clonostachys chloroleuca]